MKERFGLADFAPWLNVGGIDPTHVEEAMSLTGAVIMPRV
jgi:hypothetical protein